MPAPPLILPGPPFPGLQLGTGGTVPYVPFQAPPTIQGGPYVPSINNSGVTLDLDHLAAKPAGVDETDGYKEQWGAEDAEITRMFLVPWRKVSAFKDWIIGYAQTQPISPNDPTGANGYYIKRNLPDQHPRYPWLYASSAELVEGKGSWVVDPDATASSAPDANGESTVVQIPVMVYTEAVGGTFGDGVGLWRVVYTPRPYIIVNDNARLGSPLGEMCRWVERVEEVAIQSLPLANLTKNQLYFCEGPVRGQPVPEPGVMNLPTADLSYTLHEWTDVPRAALGLCNGRVNLADFDGAPGWPLYPKETVLLYAFRTSWKRSCVGRVSWTTNLRMAYRPTGWNTYPNGIDGKLYRATLGAPGLPGNPTVYQTADFAQLFRPVASVVYQ